MLSRLFPTHRRRSIRPGYRLGGHSRGRLSLEALELRRLMTINQVEDDGSITLANLTNVGSGQQDDAFADIGDGPYGLTSGDYDWYKISNVRPDQTIRLETFASRIGSQLDTVIGIHSATGTLLASDDDGAFGGFDSLLSFRPLVRGDYYVSVHAFGAGFQLDPFNSASGTGGFTSAGAYQLNIQVSAHVNQAPVAVNDNLGALEDTPTTLNILANDTDADGTLVPTTITIGTQPTNGTVAVNSTTGAVLYTPNTNFTGTDSFTYRVKDDEGAQSNLATVTITVDNVNDPPVANNDTKVVFKNRPAQLVIIGNDVDPDGSIDPASIVIGTQPTKGTVAINNTTGVVTYTPNNNALGNDSFTYTVRDNSGALSNSATVSIQILPIPPIANPDRATTLEDTPVVINVLANDSDPDGTIVPSSVAITAPPAHGTATINTTTGAITYTPTLNYNGSDQLTYTVQDNDGATSNTATVSITITPVNDAPLANPDTANTDAGVPVNINVLANDIDVDSNIVPSTVAISSPPASGTATVNATTGVITYTPLDTFFGQMTFTYTVKDVEGATSNSGTITVNVNALPVAVDDTAETNEDTPVLINVTANDTDPDGVAGTFPTVFEITTPPTHGTAVVSVSRSSVLYTPDADYNGDDTFQYTVRDSKGAVSKAPATVTITVKPINDPPVAVDDRAFTPVSTPVIIHVLDNDVDVDSPLVPGSVTLVTLPVTGTAVVNADGTITYTPQAGLEGADSFTYTITDSDGATSAPGKVVVRIGEAVSVSGVVYVDTNNNGVKDGNEVGLENVTVTLTKTDGSLTFSIPLLTAADGTFSFVETPDGPYILPSGTYTLKETQPGFFIDGKDTAGTPAPSVKLNDEFQGIVLAQGADATGYAFAERGLRADFIAAFVTRRAFFASADPNATIDLTQGDAFFAFDGGASGTLVATADYAAEAGDVTFTLYDNNLRVLATSSDSSQAQLQYQAASGQNYFLKVSGGNPNVYVETQLYTPPPAVWRNPGNYMDVNNDGLISAADALVVVNSLNSQGSGPLASSLVAGTSHYFVDVNGDGLLSALDVLVLVNQLNARGSASSAASPSAADNGTIAAGVEANRTVEGQVDSPNSLPQPIEPVTAGAAAATVQSAQASALAADLAWETYADEDDAIIALLDVDGVKCGL